MSVDTDKLLKSLETAPLPPELRNCVNCAHREKSALHRTMEFDQCMRTGTYWTIAIKFESYCGMDLKHWAPAAPKKRLALWQRIFRL